jgi:flagellar hook assembly protein FlgD
MQLVALHHNIPLQQARVATPATAGHTPGSGGSDGSTGISSTFLQLLTTELQTQDPLSAQDPTTYITQLVQLNTLDQLTQIHALLAAQAGTTPAQGAASQLANSLKGVQY